MRRSLKPFESDHSYSPGPDRSWQSRQGQFDGRGSYAAEPTAEESAGLLAALTGRDADADIALANRTRRAVHRAADEMKDARRQSRRSLGIAAVSVAALVLLLAPALWSGLDDMFSGEFALDLQDMVATLVFALFAAIAAVLFLLSGRAAGHEIRHLRR